LNICARFAKKNREHKKTRKVRASVTILDARNPKDKKSELQAFLGS